MSVVRATVEVVASLVLIGACLWLGIVASPLF